MYEIYRMDTGEVLHKTWIEDNATDIAKDYEKSLPDVDIAVRYAKHDAIDYARIIERMGTDDRMNLYREGNRLPSIIIRRKDTVWKLGAEGVVVTFDDMDVKPWNTNDLVLTFNGRAIATIEDMDHLEMERF